MSSSSSSCTNLIISCPGFTAVSTFMPSAFSFTLLVNSLATLKFTSASRSARRTSFMVSATLISVIFPSPFKILNERSSLSLKFSNIFLSLYFWLQRYDFFSRKPTCLCFFFIPSAKIAVALPFPSSFLQFSLVLIFLDSPSFSILIQHQKLLFSLL